MTNIEVRGVDSEDVDQLKGDLRMARVLSRAMGTRERALRHDVEIPVGRATIVLKAKYTQDAVERAKRRPGNHNQRRSAVGRELAARLASEYGERFTKDGSRDGSEEVSNETELADAIRATRSSKKHFSASGRASPVKNSYMTCWGHPRCCARRARAS